MASLDWPTIPQGDVSALPPEEQADRLAAFETRLREWSATTSGTLPVDGPVISVETSAFKGGWLMPGIESVIGQTSGAWVYSVRWDGGDDLSRRILEAVERLDHPQLRVFFGPNIGIAPSNRFLTSHSIGDYILQLDDDDMLVPETVETFVAAIRARPWSGIIRAKRDFIDEVGTHVPADPWFPFEPRHYQHGMVTDIHNHSQPALVSRAAYERTSGWDGFEEFLFAGADCDIFTKIEEVAPIVLLDEMLYHYRLSGKRTSLRITDHAAYEMWRRLADGTIARIGLPLERMNDQPPFRYRRLPRARPALDLIDVVVIPSGPEVEDVQAGAALLRTLAAVQRLGVPHDAIHVCPRQAGGTTARNETVQRATRPIVCFLRAGVELNAREPLDAMLDAMDQYDADLAGCKILDATGAIRCADPGFDAQGLPMLGGHGEADRGQFDYVAPAAWLPASALLMRREVGRAVGGFDAQYPDGLLSVADLCLKARLRDFSCLFVGTVGVDDHGPPVPMGSDRDQQRFRDRWREAAHLLGPITAPRHGDGAASETPDPEPSAYAKHCASGNAAVADGRWEEALAAFQNAVDLDASGPLAHEGLGKALAGLKRWEEAASAFAQAVAINPEMFWFQYQLGDALLRLKRFDEAIAAFGRAIAVDPGIACAHAGLGHALTNLERWRMAAAAFQQTIDLDPDAFWAHHQPGNALAKLGRSQDAAAAFERAIRLNHPDVFWAHYGLGDVRQTLGLWSEAASAYIQAIKLRSDVATAHVHLGSVLVRMEQWMGAAVAYEDASALDPSNGRVLISLGHVLSKLDRWEDAVAAYQRGVEIETDNADGHSGLGRALFRTGQWHQAVTSYRRAIELFPLSSEWHQTLGDALMNLGRLEEAADAFRRAGDLNPAWSRRPLGPGCAEVERWIAGLLPAADARATGPRTLFVFDTDYGELTTAMYLLLGQDLAAGATFLLPSRLFVINKDILPGRTRHYATMEDVLSVVDAERPDVVFLCSAYLYSLHDIFTTEELERLVALLGQRGCRVVTSDPFLGLLSDLGGSTTVSVEIPAGARADLQRLKTTLDERLNSQFAVSARILKGLPHLYPAPPTPNEPDAPRCASFFNARLLTPSGAPAEGPSDSGETPVWLFVLASRDYEVQAMFHGKGAFVNQVADKLEETVAAGRHPVFIGPFDCVQALIGRLAELGRWCVLEGVTLLTFCPFTRFASLVLSAEYVFYWNALSHSMFLRLLNSRPVFLFDRGHLVRNVTPLYERVVGWYYQGWDPIYLDPAQNLAGGHLEALARQYRSAAGAVGLRLRRSPSPRRLLDRLLGKTEEDAGATPPPPGVGSPNTQ